MKVIKVDNQISLKNDKTLNWQLGLKDWNLFHTRVDRKVALLLIFIGSLGIQTLTDLPEHFGSITNFRIFLKNNSWSK